jgi:dipeptidyl-peptidase-4
MIRTPADFDPSRRYPAIVQVYGGPAGALVQRRWLAPSDQLWLEAGFILFSIDNRGTPNRDVRFKTAIHRRMGQIEVEDQLAGIRHLAALPFVDPARIGVTGYSNGGYMTLLLLTASDTPVAAGAAGAPVSDWRLYDTHYTERYMETPDANEAGYRAADALGRIGGVKPGSLLIYHGMADDNVTLDQSTRVITALQERGVSFDMMLYPGLRHRGGWSPVALRHRHETVLDFFSERLKAETER